MKPLEDREVLASPGVSVVRRSLEQVLEELTRDSKLIYLREDGTDCRGYEFPENPVFVMGDDRDPTEEEERIFESHDPDRINLGPKSLHANHCIVVVHNEMDRREASS